MEYFTLSHTSRGEESWESQWHIEPQDFNDEAEKFFLLFYAFSVEP